MAQTATLTSQFGGRRERVERLVSKRVEDAFRAEQLAGIRLATRAKLGALAVIAPLAHGLGRPAPDLFPREPAGALRDLRSHPLPPGQAPRRLALAELRHGRHRHGPAQLLDGRLRSDLRRRLAAADDAAQRHHRLFLRLRRHCCAELLAAAYPLGRRRRRLGLDARHPSDHCSARHADALGSRRHDVRAGARGAAGCALRRPRRHHPGRGGAADRCRHPRRRGVAHAPSGPAPGGRSARACQSRPLFLAPDRRPAGRGGRAARPGARPAGRSAVRRHRRFHAAAPSASRPSASSPCCAPSTPGSSRRSSSTTAPSTSI